MAGTCTVIRSKGDDFQLVINGVVEAEFERLKREKNAEIERERAKKNALIHEKYQARFAGYEEGLAKIGAYHDYPSMANQIAGGMLMIGEDVLSGMGYALADMIDFMIYLPRGIKRYVRCIRKNIKKLGWLKLPGILRFATIKFLVDMKFIREVEG